MANADFFGRMKPGCIFINSSRGAVVDTAALLDAIHRKTVAHAVIDTWENEPNFPKELLDAADLGTAHIAGHSFEGKVWGTFLVYKEVCRFLGAAATWTPDRLLPPPLVPQVKLDAAGRLEEDALWQLVSSVYDISEDDRRLRPGNLSDPGGRAGHFSSLRLNYPVRREFRFTEAHVANASAALASTVAGLEFRVAPVHA
jgi:erythronate-4-phosphate dehydrogenase